MIINTKKNDITIYFATRVRGFFRQLFLSGLVKAKFEYQQKTVYETNSLKNRIRTYIGRSCIMDALGYIQVPKCYKIDYDIIGSFNRFLKTKKPYFIYVENPTALYHYRLNRRKSIIGSIRIRRELNNPYLKGLIFMSNACKTTFEKVCGSMRNQCVGETIYPLIPINPFVNPIQIKSRCITPELKLLYIAQGIRFQSKGGLEIIEAYRRLRLSGYNVKLRIITSLEDISSSLRNKIQEQNDLILDDFRFSFEELQKIYAESHILLQPTSDDSFNLTILEAMKSGVTILASRLYAIPEMVEDGVNGYLCDPHFWFFDQCNIPNPKVWNHRKKTIQSGEISSTIVDFLVEKIIYLTKNRDTLERLSLNSYDKASKSPFSEEYISAQWNRFFKVIQEG